MKLISKLAIKELLFNRSYTVFFIINLTIGLTSLVFLKNFNNSFEDGLQKRAKNILGADLSISGRLKLSEEKKTEVQNYLRPELAIEPIEQKSLFTMLTASDVSRLIYLIEKPLNFPFYGDLVLTQNTIGNPIEPKDNEIWVSPEVLNFFSVQIGDKLKIGEKNYKIKMVIEDDPQQTFQIGGMSPKVYISSKGLEQTGLIQFGSTIYYEIFYKFKKADFANDDLAFKISNIIDDNAQRVSTPKKSSQQMGRVIGRVTDFLGLISLVSLVLSLISLIYLFRSHLAKKRFSLATYQALGLKQSQIIASQLLANLLLSLIAGLLSATLSLALFQTLSFYIDTILKNQTLENIFMTGALYGLIVAPLISLIFTYPLMAQYLKITPQNLFQENFEQSELKESISIKVFIPLILSIYLLCIWMAHSFKIGSLFFIILFGLFLFLFFILDRILTKLQFSRPFKSLIANLSLRYISRYHINSIFIFLSLLFGSLLISFIPHMERSIQEEISDDETGPLPSLFLFDIQEEQVKDLLQTVKKENIYFKGLSPLIRGRLTKINGEKITPDKNEAFTREGQKEQRFRNRGINISYNAFPDIQNYDQIISGRPIKPYLGEGDPDISLEQRYAERFDLDLGDSLTFNIMGVEIRGVIANIRKVKWTTFLPNFFIEVAPGVFEDAPKSYVAALSQMDQIKKLKFQNQLAKKFPNISSLNLSTVAKKLKQILNQISFSLNILSWVVILVGLMVLFSLSSHQINERKTDINLLKTLGLNHKSIIHMIFNEFFLLAFLSTFLGVLFGYLLAQVFSIYVFQGHFQVIMSKFLLYPIFISLICGLMGYALASLQTRKKSFQENLI